MLQHYQIFSLFKNDSKLFNQEIFYTFYTLDSSFDSQWNSTFVKNYNRNRFIHHRLIRHSVISPLTYLRVKAATYLLYREIRQKCGFLCGNGFNRLLLYLKIMVWPTFSALRSSQQTTYVCVIWFKEQFRRHI